MHTILWFQSGVYYIKSFLKNQPHVKKPLSAHKQIAEDDNFNIRVLPNIRNELPKTIIYNFPRTNRDKKYKSRDREIYALEKTIPLH